MYRHFAKVEILIDEIIKNKNNIKEKSIVFYKTRINKFFEEYMGQKINEEKPLDAITYFDINSYLKNLDYSNAEKLNCYNALKLFFEYTYYKNLTPEIMSQVDKPACQNKPKKILNEDEYIKVKGFITSKENDIQERLILALFLFTGLSRQYIASLQQDNFIYEEGVYKLLIGNDEKKVKLPLKTELQILIHEYYEVSKERNEIDSIIQMQESSLSTYIGRLTKSIIGKQYTPTDLSNTFIAKALSNGNHVWEVSKLTLESVSTIERHVLDINEGVLFNKQMAILSNF